MLSELPLSIIVRVGNPGNEASGSTYRYLGTISTRKSENEAASEQTMAAFDQRTAPQIQRLLLTNVRLTGRSFGSYRSAVELEMGGTAMTCVGKQIRDTASLAVFLEECGTLFDLRHPHIVQYLGVFVSDSGSAHVVMEYLPHSLDHVA